MRFAVEEINRRTDLLPNVTLGFQVIDSCSGLQLELYSTLQLLTGQDQGIPNYSCRERPPLPVIIGHSISTFSILMAYILGLYKYPQISHFSTSSLLSERTQFPSFFRTVPSDVFQSKGLAELILHFGWTWVGLIALNDDYGELGIQIIKQELLSTGACVAFTEYIMINRLDRNAPHLTKTVRESTAKAIVVFSTDAEMVPFLDEMLLQNVSRRIFVASEAWSMSDLLLVKKYSSLLSGTIGFAFHSSTIPEFKGYLNSINPFNSLGKIWVKIFWEKAFECKLIDEEILLGLRDNSTKLCTGNENLETLQLGYNDLTNLRGSYNLYTAIYVIAKSLHDLQTCQDGRGPFYNGSCAEFQNFKPWQVPISVCSPSCPSGSRRVVKKGAPVCCFHCVPCPQGEISNQTDSIDCSTCPRDKWPNLGKDKCLPKAIEFLSYEETLGATLAAISIISSLIPFSIFGLFFHYKTTPIVRANNYYLSCLLLLSLSLCFLCSLAFIGYPEPEKCLLRQAAFGMVFALCVSCILAKTIMVVFAFMATKPGSSLKKWANPQVSYTIIAVCSLLQLLLCISWLSCSPPFPEYNTQTQPGILIIECNENSQTAFWCMLGYLGFLATFSFIVAFLARSLPDNFNEAKFITFSMLAFLSVWLSFIPASLSARGKYTVAMEVFAILSSSWALVICMFVPKCFIILFRPQMNSKQHLLGKAKL
ncbi:extracellular calcium-sensing receptor-like [Discoglossus pictus]